MAHGVRLRIYTGGGTGAGDRIAIGYGCSPQRHGSGNFGLEVSNTVFLFEIVFPVFLLFGFWFLYNIIKKQQNAETFLLWFTLAGSYVAISWGCGNSGGLAEGQATTGVAICCCIYSVWTKLSVASDITGGSGSRLHRLNDSILHQKDGEYL